MVPPIEYPKKVKQTDKKQTLSGSVTPTLQISNLFQLVLQMATKLQLKARLAFTH
jgi:phage-related protein